MITLSINIDVAAAGWKKAFPKMREKIEQAAAVAVMRAKKPKSFDKKTFEVNVLLTTDSTIKKLNHDYLGKNKATNVLSFPQENQIDTGMLGDIALAFQTLKRECREQKKTLENHCIHLVVHGVLHLFGYDHMKMKDAKSMEKLECDILASMGYPDPYQENTVKKPRSKKVGR